MENYLNEEVFLGDNYNKILYADEHQLGSEYIIHSDGAFTKYFFSGGKCAGFKVISFNEFFKYYSRGMRLPLAVCKITRLEVLVLLIVGFIIKSRFALGVIGYVFKFNSLLDIIIVVGISFCLVEIIFNSKSYIAELCRKLLQIYLVVKLGEVIIISYKSLSIVKGVVIFLVSLYIIASMISVNIKVSLDSMYKDLIEKFLN